MDSAIDAAGVLALDATMLFPASLILEGEIMIGVGQHMPFSFLPELEGDAVRLQDFFRRVVAEVSLRSFVVFGRRNNLPFLTLRTKGTG